MPSIHGFGIQRLGVRLHGCLRSLSNPLPCNIMVAFRKDLAGLDKELYTRPCNLNTIVGGMEFSAKKKVCFWAGLIERCRN